jgi:hypothetical protein
MAAASNSVLDSAVPFNAIRRNIMIGSALAFLLMFTDVDASEFKFFEVRIDAATLLAVLAAFLGYYLLIFSVRLILLFVAGWIENRHAREEQRKAAKKAIRDAEERGEMLAYQRVSPIFRALYRMPNVVTIYVILFEFMLPFLFGTLMLIQLSQRVSLISFMTAAFRV